MLAYNTDVHTLSGWLEHFCHQVNDKVRNSVVEITLSFKFLVYNYNLLMICLLKLIYFPIQNYNLLTTLFCTYCSNY